MCGEVSGSMRQQHAGKHTGGACREAYADTCGARWGERRGDRCAGACASSMQTIFREELAGVHVARHVGRYVAWDVGRYVREQAPATCKHACGRSSRGSMWRDMWGAVWRDMWGEMYVGMRQQHAANNICKACERACGERGTNCGERRGKRCVGAGAASMQAIMRENLAGKHVARDRGDVRREMCGEVRARPVAMNQFRA